MQPASPVIRGFEQHESTFAKDQPEYIPLPAIRCEDGQIITRWRLSLLERIKLALCGNIYLHVHTFNQPLQPVFLEVNQPKLETK